MSTTAHFSLEQYELMVSSGVFSGPHEQRVELIRGEILKMSPINEPHAWIVDLLGEWSFNSSDRSRVRVRNQAPLRFPELESAPQPDIIWLDRRDYSKRHPEPSDVFLPIEVAETSLETDTTTKAALYAEAGIGDYWVVDIATESILVFRDPTGNRYATCQTITGATEIRPLEFPEVALTPAALFSSRQD